MRFMNNKVMALIFICQFVIAIHMAGAGKMTFI